MKAENKMPLWQLRLSINVLVYTLFYLVKAFVIWRFTNPFQWIIDMPTYTGEMRFGILAGIGLYYIFLVFFTSDLIRDKNSLYEST